MHYVSIYVCMYMYALCTCMYVHMCTYIYNTYQMKNWIKHTRGRGQLNYVLMPHKRNERSRCAVFTVLISNGIYDPHPHPDTSTFTIL